MKKSLKCGCFFGLILFFFSLSSRAQEPYANINKEVFLMPSNAAVGGANLAFSADAGPMSNPANISFNTHSSIALSYSGYFANTYSVSMSTFATRINQFIGVGSSVGYIYVPEIAVTEHFVTDGSGNLIYDPVYKSSSELYMNFAFSYLFPVTDKFHLATGASIHCQRRRLIDWTGYGIGVDIGLTCALPESGLRFSVLFDDITTNYIHWSSSYHDNGAPHARLGIGWKKELPYVYGVICMTYKSPDLLSNEGVGYNYIGAKNDEEKIPEKINFKKNPGLLFANGYYGCEYVIHKIVALRIGFNEPKRFVFGGGLNLFSQSLSFDFSYMTSNADLPGTYALSSGYSW